MRRTLRADRDGELGGEKLQQRCLEAEQKRVRLRRKTRRPARHSAGRSGQLSLRSLGRRASRQRTYPIVGRARPLCLAEQPDDLEGKHHAGTL
jgi:hypothetical protein